ncbi:MAG: hypothetical protein K2L00_06250 [Muribaculaceae bacterium]|nr:hypothetical protein [Muribaculaceae bacterium]
MRKSHLEYLRRIIGKAIADHNRGQLTDSILQMKAPVTPIHVLMRDIVCDARFYSVTDNDMFWKKYGAFKIGRFVDSLAPDEWDTAEYLTIRKEEFLNDWMASHMIPLSADERRVIAEGIRLETLSGDNMGMPDPDDHDGDRLGIVHLGHGIKDTTNQTGEPAEGLPPRLADYMKDASGGNSPGLKSEGHRADARFLADIHPSIVRLAEMIGRRGGNISEKKGKFRTSPKSDISGVSVGDDLGSVLPMEIALLATPDSEKIFLDRFARKRLQIFSSVSRTRETGKEKRGPIFICVDTSGSMSGAPEEMAKTLVLAICIVAQKEARTVCIFNYSDSISFFVLHSLEAQRRRLLRFLSKSYGGGNDENRLVDFIFSRMPRLAAYSKFAGQLEDADMLVISDFNWIGLDHENSALLQKSRKRGMRIFSVGVDITEREIFQEHEEESAAEDEPGYTSGHRFFRRSDFKFRFEDGRIK